MAATAFAGLSCEHLPVLFLSNSDFYIMSLDVFAIADRNQV